MFRKKIKIEVPKVKMCTRCGTMAKVNDLKLTHDDVLSVLYICDCGKEDCWNKNVKFI
ncbi:MAG: hypothetical protein RR891_07545 [Clostridium sp.]